VKNKVSEGEAVHQIGGVQTGTCPGGVGATHKIVLKNNAAHPRAIEAQRCDTLMIVNEDDVEREIEFGVHEQHEMYAGESGKVIRPGRNMTFRLTELGTYHFHDHILDEISGDFMVKP
jgi:hypothetical protein